MKILEKRQEELGLKMTSEALKIEQILIQYDFNKRNKDAKTSIAKIENTIHFPLPEDYLFYVTNYVENEGFVGNEFLRLWDLDDLLQFNTEYQITQSLKNTIGIGENGSSEFIAIEYMGNMNYRLVLSPFIDLNSKYHIEVGNSFTDFFQRLQNGKNWF